MTSTAAAVTFGDDKFSTGQQHNNMSINHFQETSSTLSLTTSGGNFQPAISVVAVLTTTIITNATSTITVAGN